MMLVALTTLVSTHAATTLADDSTPPLAPTAGSSQQQASTGEAEAQATGAGSAASAATGPGVLAGPTQINNLAVVTIDGPIDAMTSVSMKRRFEQAITAGADGIVIELNTPGGEVGAVLEMTALIRDTNVPVIAWVNDDAYSAGAIIAIACDEIVLSSAATMGDAAPIAANPLTGIMALPETERAKLLSPLIAEVVDSARRNGYDEVLVTSFVQVGVETWMVTHNQTGQKYFLTEREYTALFGSEPPRATPLVQSGVGAAGQQAQSPPQSSTAPANNTAPAEESPGMDALSDVTGPDIAQAAAINITALSTRPDFAQEDPADYTFVQYATDGKTLLTVREQDLRTLGFTRYASTIDSDADLKTYVAATNLVRLNITWSERFVGFATQGASGLLFRGAMIVLFLLGLFVEMAVPGMGLAGLVALIALAGLIVPPMMIGASSWWTLAAIMGGVLLIVLEIFVIPGLGIPGVLGLVLIVAGLVGTFAGVGELFPGQNSGGGLGWALSTIFFAFFITGICAYFVTKYTRSVPVLNRLILTETMATYDQPGRTTLLESMSPALAGVIDVGDVGKTTVALRPEGEAEFNETLYTAIAVVGYIPHETPVRVVRVEGETLYVEPADQPEINA